jgi:hypothetical protein
LISALFEGASEANAFFTLALLIQTVNAAVAIPISQRTERGLFVRRLHNELRFS